MPGLEAIAYVIYYSNVAADEEKERAGETEVVAYDEDDDGLQHFYVHIVATGASHKIYYDRQGEPLLPPVYRFASDEPVIICQ